MSSQSPRFSELLTEYLTWREDSQRPEEEQPGSISDRAALRRHADGLLEQMDELIHEADALS
jgi:hypothetical protein